MRLPRFAVRKALIYTHRWLGIAGSVLFLAWFVSGMVMMYHRMPALDPSERFERLPELDLAAVSVAPADAAAQAVFRPEHVRIGMFEGRPVYRFARGRERLAVFADDGSAVGDIGPFRALEIVRAFAPEHAPAARHIQRMEESDQWTLSLSALMPLHRVALGDPGDTQLYVSELTGEVVMKTTARGRRWAYAGAVLHWLYFTPFRKHTALWIDSVIWLSIAGCVLSLSGLIWGVWRFSGRARYRVRGVQRQSPYAGLMRWHHYAGLIFGLTTFTWVLSGCLSLDPWDWHPSTSPSSTQRGAFSGGPLQLNSITPESLRDGLGAIRSSLVPKELELVQFGSEPYLIAYCGDGKSRTVSARRPRQGAFERFSRDDLLAAALVAMKGNAIADAACLDDYDDYYYDRAGKLPLPVLRIRYDDPPRTWLYVDPARGEIIRKEERLTRLNRWLYHGLHNLDFRFLYSRRPLWDIVVIVLSLGGILLVVSSAVQGWHRLRRHARRLTRP